MTTNSDRAKKLYPTTHVAPAKKRPQNGNLTHAAGGAGREPQQQRNGNASTAKPNNAAKGRQ
jgi:hypothetical protein